MRIIAGVSATQMSLQFDAEPQASLAGQERASPLDRTQGTPGGGDGGVQPNLQLPEMVVRFVSSLAQFDRQTELHAGPVLPAKVDLSAIVSKYIGETEKNLDAVFRGAEPTGSALLFDEADALFGRHTDVNDSHDRYAEREAIRHWPWK